MIVMIDNYDSFTYNLVQYIGELGAEVEMVRGRYKSDFWIGAALSLLGEVRIAIPYSALVRPGGFAEARITAGATTAPIGADRRDGGGRGLLDGVFVCTPPAVHLGPARAAFVRGALQLRAAARRFRRNMPNH